MSAKHAKFIRQRAEYISETVNHLVERMTEDLPRTQADDVRRLLRDNPFPDPSEPEDEPEADA